MTKALFHGSIKGFRGQIGDLIFRLLPDGTTVVTKAPLKKTRRQKKRNKLKRSPRQQAHNSHFAEAIAYGRVAQFEQVYVELAAVTPMMTAYNIALSDWWHAPRIHNIERAPGCIHVEVTDDVMVNRVQVTILDEAGTVLERGEAIRGEGDWWEFASHTQGKKIMAEAWDLPGHVTRFELHS